MTCCASLCILAYVSLIITGSFILGRDYTSESEKLYQSLKNADIDEITAYQFIPVVQILRYSEEDSEEKP